LLFSPLAYLIPQFLPCVNLLLFDMLYSHSPIYLLRLFPNLAIPTSERQVVTLSFGRIFVQKHSLHFSKTSSNPILPLNSTPLSKLAIISGYASLSSTSILACNLKVSHPRCVVKNKYVKKILFCTVTKHN